MQALLRRCSARPLFTCFPQCTSVFIASLTALTRTHSQAHALPPLPKAIAEADVKLEELSDQLLGLDTIQKGAPLDHSDTPVVFNGKYGTVPVVLKQAADSAGSLAMLLNETTTIMKLRHPNVAQAFGIWKDAMEAVFVVFVDIICVDFAVHTRLLGSTFSMPLF